MAKYIELDKVLDLLETCNSDGLKGIFCSYKDGKRFEEYIKKLPTEDVKPIVYAELRIVGNTTMHYECSQCGEAVDKWDNYCKHCGARMKKECEEKE